jgi:predicted anti-sigma-YlaC factor YlaD
VHCERQRPLLSTLFDGEAPCDVRPHLLEHLALCAECRAFFRATKFLQAALATVQGPPG